VPITDFNQCVSDLVSCPIDMVFVVDASANVGDANFNQVKSFLSQFVAKLDVNGGNARVSVVTYADNVVTTIELDDHSDVGNLQTDINGLIYQTGDTNRNTHLALKHVRQNVLQTAVGDRDNVPNLVVVLHSGVSDDERRTSVSVHIRRYLQLRFDFNSISIRQPFEGRSTGVRLSKVIKVTLTLHEPLTS